MAFPAINSNTATSVATASTTHNINMPPTVAFGDLLTVILSTRTNTAQNIPSGWKQIVTGVIGTTAGVRLGIYAKRATGSEGGTTVNFSTAATAVAAARCLRVLRADWYGSVQLGVHAAVVATATSNSPMAGTSDPGFWATEDTLWIECYAAEDDDAVSSYPANMPDNRAATIATTGTSTCSMAMASRNDAVGSLAANAFTMAASDVWAATTIGIRPNAQNNFHNQVNGMSGVVAHYKLNEASGTTAYDSGPNSDISGTLNGTYTNTPTLAQAGQVDEGVALDPAASEYVLVGDQSLLELPSVGSLCAVVKLDNFDSFRHIAGKKGGGNRGYGLWSDSGGRFTMLFGNGSTENRLEVSTGVANTWYIIICTWDTGANAYRMYINGVQVDTDSFAGGALSHTTEQFNIGAEDAGGFGWQDGIIDEVVVFDRAISLAENESLATASGLMVTPVSMTRTMVVESLDRATQTRVARMENIARIVDTGVIRVENLDRITQIRAPNIESLDRATTTRLSNVEYLDRVAQTSTPRIESLDGVTQTRDIDIENLDRIVQTRTPNIESIGNAVSQVRILRLESLLRIADLTAVNIESLLPVATPISALAVILLESLQRVAIQEIINLESLRRTLQTRAVNFENLQEFLLIVNRILQLESLDRILNTRVTNLESLDRVTQTRTPNIESIGNRVSQVRMLRIESLMRLAALREADYESLDRVINTRSPNIESLGNRVTQLRILRMENLMRIATTREVDWESNSPINLVVGSRTLRIESLQRLAIAKSTNIENLAARLLMLRAVRIESLGNRVSQLRAVRLESLQRLAFTRVINFESLVPAGLVISNRILQIESLAALRFLKTTNLESLASRVLQLETIRLESLLGLRRTSGVNVEYIEGVGLVIHISPINIETLKRLAVTRLTNWEIVTQGALIPPDLIVIDPGGEEGIIIIGDDGSPIIVVPPDDNNIIVGGGDSDVIIVWEDSQQMGS